MSTHLETLRLMRAMAKGDHAAALDHAIAVLDGCHALNRDALADEFVGVMGPSADAPTWEVGGIEATNIEGAIAAYAESRR